MPRQLDAHQAAAQTHIQALSLSDESRCKQQHQIAAYLDPANARQK